MDSDTSALAGPGLRGSGWGCALLPSCCTQSPGLGVVLSHPLSSPTCAVSTPSYQEPPCPKNKCPGSLCEGNPGGNCCPFLTAGWELSAPVPAPGLRLGLFVPLCSWGRAVVLPPTQPRCCLSPFPLLHPTGAAGVVPVPRGSAVLPARTAVFSLAVTLLPLPPGFKANLPLFLL